MRRSVAVSVTVGVGVTVGQRVTVGSAGQVAQLTVGEVAVAVAVVMMRRQVTVDSRGVTVGSGGRVTVGGVAVSSRT